MTWNDATWNVKHEYVELRNEWEFNVICEFVRVILMWNDTFSVFSSSPFNLVAESLESISILVES